MALPKCLTIGCGILAFQVMACLGSDLGEDHVEGFFLSRFEVTVGEYLKFVNDPEVLARIDADGKALPESDGAKREAAQ